MYIWPFQKKWARLSMCVIVVDPWKTIPKKSTATRGLSPSPLLVMKCSAGLGASRVGSYDHGSGARDGNMLAHRGETPPGGLLR